MDLFNLQASITLDTGDYERAVEDATKKSDDIEKSFKGVGAAASETDTKTKNLSNQMKVVSNAYNEAAKRVEDLGDELDKSIKETGESSDESKRLASELDKAEKEANGLAKKMDALGKEMDEAAESTEDTTSGFKSFTGSIGESVVKANLITKGLSLIGNAAKSLASYVWNLDEATEEYRVSQTKLNATFKTAGFNAATASQAFTELYRATGDIDRATEASQLLANLAQSTQDIATWAEIATGVVGTFGDALPIESLIESANETARTGQVVGTLADALNWAGQVGEDDFNVMLAACATTEERVRLITETLSGTYLDAADAFKETSKSVMDARDAHLRLEEAQAKVGEETQRLKNALVNDFSFSLIGATGMLEFYTGKLADVAEEGAKSKESYQQFVSSIEQRISTGNVDEAKAAIRELSEEMERIGDADYQKTLKETLGFFGTTGYLNTIYDLYEKSVEWADNYSEGANDAAGAADGLTDATNKTAEAIDKITFSANGMTFELENSGLTAEEASARLQSYTDAATNMFQKINTESELSYADAVANLEANIQATNDFAANMTELSSVLPKEMADMFASGGPSMYAGIVSMLAEANRGTDEGLTQINQLYEQGGEAAVNAFLTSLGMVPDDAQNPATIVAAQMDQDTAMETAAEGVVTRTAKSFADAVDSAGFDSAGQKAMDKFIQGMESKRSDVLAKAESIANAAASKINNALNNIGSGSGGRASAGGLDYVPYNGYPAILHAGEAVLTASEAKDWRAGRSPKAGGGITINQYISAVPQTPVEFAAATQAYFEQARWEI